MPCMCDVWKSYWSYFSFVHTTNRMGRGVNLCIAPSRFHIWLVWSGSAGTGGIPGEVQGDQEPSRLAVMWRRAERELAVGSNQKTATISAIPPQQTLYQQNQIIAFHSFFCALILFWFTGWNVISYKLRLLSGFSLVNCVRLNNSDWSTGWPHPLCSHPPRYGYFLTNYTTI